jgi:hypothetical protein
MHAQSSNGLLLAVLTLWTGCGSMREETMEPPRELSLSTGAALAAAPWELVNPMTTDHDYSASATLLDDGQVLVVGALNSAATELFNPANGTWSPVGNLSVGRSYLSASKLGKGKVLVSGGYNQVTYIANADLYDPATKSWAPAAPLAIARGGHTSTLLLNGKVLVTGGQHPIGSNPGYSGPSNTAELYDPVTNTWSSAGTMSRARDKHTATLLQSGKVLVVGGPDGTRAELYDPVTNSWSLAGQISQRRESATATLLPNGKVLLAGGQSYANGVYPILSTAELYDPATNTWSLTASMGSARSNHGAVRLADGRVLVAGGYQKTSTDNNVFLASAELYDPTTGTWTATSPMNHFRLSFPLTRLPDGNVLAVSDKTAELYRASEEVALGSLLGTVASATTCGARDDFAPVCGGGSGGAPDIAFLWTAPKSTSYLFSTSGSLDTVLELQQVSSGASLGCNDTDPNETVQSQLWRSVTAGQQLRIIVDGNGSACGGFQLSISESRYNPF